MFSKFVPLTRYFILTRAPHNYTNVNRVDSTTKIQIHWFRT